MKTAQLKSEIMAATSCHRNPKTKGDRMEQRLSENHSFDFDIGYLVKSPCRDCHTRESLPDCIQGCEILDQIQTVLADSIPSETNFSPVEAFDLPVEILEQI